jgi:AAA15 family ATPase/GTPase
MKEEEIIQYHTRLYTYLKSVPNLKFRVRRMNNQRRLEKGYWFNGNMGYLETSFWDYKDNLHTTPIIRLHYAFDTKTWGVDLVARDKKFKGRVAYFNSMAKEIGGFTPDDKYSPTKWEKKLEKDADFILPIKKFIDSEKKKIDEFIDKKRSFDIKNDELVRAIDNIVFQNDITRIENAINENERPESRKNSNSQSIFKPKFSYSIASVDISNYRGIKSIVIGDDGDDKILPNTQWIILTGENGFGKTSILMAIANALTENELEEFTDGGQNIIFKAYRNGEEITNDRGESSLDDEFDIKDDSDIKKIVAYGVSRFIVNSKESNLKRTESLFLVNDAKPLLSIEQKLLNNDEKYDEIRKKLLQVLPNIKSIEKRIKPNGDPEIIFTEIDSEGNEIAEKIGLNKLGAGYRGIFTMIGDMIIRLSDDLTLPLDKISGIVLIDEIDAHLHPKYQYELPNLLTNAFPEVQFIVSTHSPIPILGLPPEKNGKEISVIYTVKRTPKGIELERWDDKIDLNHMSANALLSSEVFGHFKNIFPRGSTPDTIIPLNPNKDTVTVRLSNMRDAIKELKIKPYL